MPLVPVWALRLHRRFSDVKRGGGGCRGPRGYAAGLLCGRRYEYGGDTFAAPDGDELAAAALPMPAWKVRKPVIAAVNRHTIGIGFTIALQCDIRIFADDAKYGIVQVRRGVMGDGYSHWTLPRIAGMSAAAEILLTGQTFDGHKAREFGICSQVLPADEVLSVGA